MYEIYFYEDTNGNNPILDYIEKLSKRTDKDSRINYNKINDYIQALSEYGKTAKEPYIKHLDGDIWELRPLRTRIFFADWLDDGFMLLHYLQFKKTQKTPKSEIDRAKSNLKEMRERSGV